MSTIVGQSTDKVVYGETRRLSRFHAGAIPLIAGLAFRVSPIGLASASPAVLLGGKHE